MDAWDLLGIFGVYGFGISARGLRTFMHRASRTKYGASKSQAAKS